MNISILLPYKENYSSNYPGAVSIFISSVIKKSIYKKNITVYGSTNFKNFLSKNYINIKLNRNIFLSQTKTYLANFKKLLKTKKTDLIEIHNRPNYVRFLADLKKKIVLYFHNDPTTMLGSRSANERIKLVNHCSKIISMLTNKVWHSRLYLSPCPNFKYFICIIVITCVNKLRLTWP